MIDPETKAMLLRIAVVTNVLFGVFGYKAALSHAFLKRFLGLLAAPRRYINVGLVVRSDDKGVRGNFSLPVLLILTAAFFTWFVAHPESFFVVLGCPLWVMRSSTLTWQHWTSPWFVPVNILITIVTFWFGLIFGVVFWFQMQCLMSLRSRCSPSAVP